MDLQEEVDEVLDDVDERSKSDKMSPDEWKEFLSELIDGLQARLDAAKESS